MIRKFFVAVFSSLCILALILDSRTALSSAITGIEQCIYTVVPALFPFFLFSSLLVSMITSSYIPALARIGQALGIPQGGETLFLAGILGGYPVSASCIAQAHRHNGLKDADAQHMMGYCVNAGPSFLFGICGALFTQPWIPWILWSIHVVSALIVGALLRRTNTKASITLKPSSASMSDALRSSIRNMAQVCGWIVLFRVLIGLMDRWVLWLLPKDLRCLLIGALELTNGCLELKDIASEGLRFILCSAFLALGGLCVLMQVQAVAGKVGLGRYLPGKLLQCLISTLLAVIAQFFLFDPSIAIADAAAPAILLTLLLIACIPFSSYYKKSGSIYINNHV